jgi:hypothetical protein
LWERRLFPKRGLPPSSHLVSSMQTKVHKIRNIKRAADHERKIVRESKDVGFRTESSKPIDVVIFRHGGKVDVVDAKFTDKDFLVISKHDIKKGLDVAEEMERRGHSARFIIDMHFPQQRKHRTIVVPHKTKKSIRAYVKGPRVMTKLVSRGV